MDRQIMVSISLQFGYWIRERVREKKKRNARARSTTTDSIVDKGLSMSVYQWQGNESFIGEFSFTCHQVSTDSCVTYTHPRAYLWKIDFTCVRRNFNRDNRMTCNDFQMYARLFQTWSSTLQAWRCPGVQGVND